MRVRFCEARIGCRCPHRPLPKATPTPALPAPPVLFAPSGLMLPHVQNRAIPYRFCWNVQKLAWLRLDVQHYPSSLFLQGPGRPKSSLTVTRTASVPNAVVDEGVAVVANLEVLPDAGVIVETLFQGMT